MQTIGRYEIAEKLGEGGMGTVYKAYDPLLARVVAVKVISGQLDSQPEQRERFFREARAAAQLSHPNIITIYDLGEQDGKPFLAMEYLVGRDLDARMHAPEGMSLARKVEIAMAICQGLAHAHASGVVHRDIKPANVFLANDGAVKLLDFGLARLITSELTRSNMMLGTLNYMAPEQLRAERTDHRADIFSLGVVLYELLSGKKPFQGDSFASTMYKILQETPEPLERIDASLPAQLTTVVDRALAKAREDRYQSVLDLLRDLEAAYETLRGADRRVIERVESALATPAPPRPPSGTHPDAMTMADVTLPMVYGSVPPRTPTPSAAAPPATAPPATAPPATAPSAASPGTATVPAQPRKPVIVAAALGVIGISLAGFLYFARSDTADPIEPEAGSPAAALTVPTPEPAPVPPAAPPGATPPEPSADGSQPSEPAPPPVPERAEPDPRQAEAARVSRLMREAQSLFDARRYEEAERTARQVQALDRTHAGARALLARIDAIEGAHAAQSRRSMEAARQDAIGAQAPDLVAQLFESAERQAESARAAEAERRFTAAAARFDAAAALYSSAAAAARREAETRAARARDEQDARRRQEDEARQQREEQARREREAAAVRTPPPAPAPVPPPPAAPAAEELIAGVVGRYVRALEARDIGALRAIWPGLSGAALAAIESEFANARSIDVAFSGSRIEVDGASATVTGIRRYGLLTRDGQQLRSETRTTIALRRADGGWVIESIRHQPVN
ncbi:MAG TPA: protein kinase [Vicinamibacterales bacterium]